VPRQNSTGGKQRLGGISKQATAIFAENTLVILMADNGPFTHNGPSGMAETLYRGGKGD
jgi:arylsulfatase A-like enzyme